MKTIKINIWQCKECDEKDPCILQQNQDCPPIHCPHDSGYIPKWEEVKK